MWKRLHVKYSLFLSNFNKILIFSTDFREKPQCKILSKSVRWEPSCSMRIDRQTDMKQLIVAFGDPMKAPKNSTFRPRGAFMFCIVFRSSSIDFLTQYYIIGFHNREQACLLRGTSWIFKSNLNCSQALNGYTSCIYGFWSPFRLGHLKMTKPCQNT